MQKAKMENVAKKLELNEETKTDFCTNMFKYWMKYTNLKKVTPRKIQKNLILTVSIDWVLTFWHTLLHINQPERLKYIKNDQTHN